jgi:hypothetical protein
MLIQKGKRYTWWIRETNTTYLSNLQHLIRALKHGLLLALAREEHTLAMTSPQDCGLKLHR